MGERRTASCRRCVSHAGLRKLHPLRAAAAAGPRIARQHASRIAASQGEAEAAIPAPAPLPTQLSLVEKAVGDGVARVVGWWSELARAA